MPAQTPVAPAHNAPGVVGHADRARGRLEGAVCVRSSPAERPARNGVELARVMNCGGVGPGVTSRPLP